MAQLGYTNVNQPTTGGSDSIGPGDMVAGPKFRPRLVPFVKYECGLIEPYYR